jgi:hypothetical protein
MEPRIPRYVPATNVVMKLFARLGVKTGPVNVITVAGRKSGQPRSTPVTPWVVDGKKYVISGRTTTRVRLTEVTDPALKERVVTSFGTENRAGGSFLKQAGVAPDRTPKGIAAATPHVAVFEVTPADR